MRPYLTTYDVALAVEKNWWPEIVALADELHQAMCTVSSHFSDFRARKCYSTYARISMYVLDSLATNKLDNNNALILAKYLIKYV